MRLLIATKNKNKVREFNSLFSDLSKDILLESLSDINYENEIEENGNSFEENSYIKAAALASLGYTAIADDSGLCVDALGGKPGIYSARYSGTGNDDANIDYLLSEMKSIPDDKRSAKFVCVITCAIPKHSKVIVARGECEGTILRERRGENGFGYDPVFYLPQFDKTFAQLNEDEKNKISHRGRAMECFKKQFYDYIDYCKEIGKHL